MKKFKLKSPRYSFDHEGMIIRGKLRSCEPIVDVYARDLCEDNMDIMSKMDVKQCMFKCMFNGNDFTWAYTLDELEPLEVIKITQLDYELLKFVQKQGAKYICRDKKGILNLFENEPYIISECDLWYVEGKGKREYFINFTQQLFQFVTWESQKYYVIKDVLNNCEVVKDENCL